MLAGAARGCGAALALALAPAALAQPWTDRWEVSGTAGLMHRRLAERAASGATLLTETGPMALCIVRSDAGPKAPDLESRKGLNVVYWLNGTHAFMLIGHAPAGRMTAIAFDVRGRGLD